MTRSDKNQIQNKTRVVLIEDHAVYREIIELALRNRADVELLQTFGAAEVALRSLRGNTDAAQPEVVLLDLNLPGMTGIEAIPELLATSRDLKIVVLTQSTQEADVLQAMTLGAVGYLLKSATVTQIVDGIRSAVNGDIPLDAGVAKYILTTMKRAKPSQSPSEFGQLTDREVEILQLIADGLTKKQIASKLGLSNSTVSTHAVHIFEKLSVQNAPAAVAKAFRIGVLSPE